MSKGLLEKIDTILDEVKRPPKLPSKKKENQARVDRLEGMIDKINNASRTFRSVASETSNTFLPSDHAAVHKLAAKMEKDATKLIKLINKLEVRSV